MWIFEILLYSSLLLFFLYFNQKKNQWKKQIRQEEAFEHYLSELAVSYGKRQNIAEAVYEVEEKYTVTLQPAHPYVRIFEAMCAIIGEDGDEKEQGLSIFQQNLHYLREEIRENLLASKEKEHLFLGLDLLAFLPIWFMPLVRIWAVRSSAGLKSYYSGSFGLITTICLFGSTVLLYGLILWLLLPQGKRDSGYWIEKKLLDQKVISKLTDQYMNRNYSKCLRKNELMKQLQGFGNIREFLVRKVICGICGFLIVLTFNMMYIHAEKKQVKEQISLQEYQLQLFSLDMQEQVNVDEELNKEQKKGFQWYQLLFAICAGLAAIEIPELALVANKWKSREKRVEECLRMQTIVLLRIHYEKTTVEDILESMEVFAELFKTQLAEAVDSFSYHRTEAIEKLKQEIMDEPVQRICDAMEFCEELPVKEAFMNLEDEREYFLKKNMDERKHYQREYAALAKMAAYIPLFLLIILKMVIPFVAEGLSELSMYSQNMMGMF